MIYIVNVKIWTFPPKQVDKAPTFSLAWITIVIHPQGRSGIITHSRVTNIAALKHSCDDVINNCGLERGAGGEELGLG